LFRLLLLQCENEMRAIGCWDQDESCSSYSVFTMIMQSERTRQMGCLQQTMASKLVIHIIMSVAVSVVGGGGITPVAASGKLEWFPSAWASISPFCTGSKILARRYYTTTTTTFSCRCSATVAVKQVIIIMVVALSSHIHKNDNYQHDDQPLRVSVN
jgi:hypothetical protein